MAVDQIQDSCGQSGNMFRETDVSLLSTMIPNRFLFGGKSNANIFHKKKDTNNSLPIKSCFIKYNAIRVQNLSHQNFDKRKFYDDLCAQLKNGTICSVTNKFKPRIKMKGFPSKDIIITEAEKMIKLPENVLKGIFDMICYYYYSFTETLLTDNDAL